MVGIYVYKNCSKSKNYKFVLNYDEHKYKKEELLSGVKNQNITLFDNTKSFEKDVKQLQRNLKEINKTRRGKNHKTHEELKEAFSNKSVMRNFRFEINCFDVDRLTKNANNENERRQIIADFYKDQAEAFVHFLEQKSENKAPIKIVKAEVHFDQSNPHMHLHLSNLYLKHNKELNKEIMSCSIHNTDFLTIQTKLKHEYKNEYGFKDKLEAKLNGEWLSPSQFFYQNFFNIKFKKEHYQQANNLMLKELFPKTFNQKRYSREQEKFIKIETTRDEKMVSLKNSEKILKKLGYDISKFDNEIDKQKEIHKLTNYSIYQMIARKVLIQEQEPISEEELKKEIERELHFQSVVMEDGFINYKDLVLEPDALKKTKQIELSNMYPQFTNLELDLKYDLKIKFENHNDLIKENKQALEYTNMIKQNKMSIDNQNQQLHFKYENNYVENLNMYSLKSNNENKVAKLLVDDFKNEYILTQNKETKEIKIETFNNYVHNNNLKLEQELDNLKETKLENKLELDNKLEHSLNLKR